jgi:histidinol-phosphate aminotransferase
MTPERLLRPDLRQMEPYTPIVPFEVLSARLGRPPEDIVKLDANENPYGPPPAALAALAAGRSYHIYPDPEANALRDALANYTGQPKERLLAGMGADELIDLVLRAVLEPGDVVVDCPPSFGMYPFSTAVNGGRYLPVPRRADFALDSAAIETAVAAEPRAKVLFVCSPNNPDGGVVDDATLRRLLTLPLLVVLDEAYVDFAAAEGFPSRLNWVGEHDNLVVLRTFSKLAGLAGLRVGYGAFPGWLLPHLWKIKQPYNVNVAASLAGVVALEETEWLHETVGRLVAERNRIARETATLGWLRPLPSRANFVLCRVVGTSAAEVKRGLEAEGVLVRYFDKPGLRDCIRISAGRPEHTDRLLAALRRLVPTQSTTPDTARPTRSES